MFWEQFADDVVEEKGVASVLSRSEFTLRDILREDDVLQECAMSAPLLTYLSREEVVEQLVDLITKPAGEDATQEERFRDPFLACELLRFGHAAVLDAFFRNEDALLERLLSPLRAEDTLHSLVAEYVSRVLLKLLDTRKEQMLRYLRRRSDQVQRLVLHMENASILNVLTTGLFVAGTEEVEVRDFAVDFGNSRLQRQFDASCLSWFAELRLPASLVQCVLQGLPSASNALECLRKIIEYSPSGSVLLQQLLDSQCLTSVRDTMRERPSIATAQLVELLIGVGKTWFAPCNFDLLIEAVFLFSDYAGTQGAQTSLGAVRLQCVTLWASAMDSLPFKDGVAPHVAALSNWFFLFPNASLFHVSFATVVRRALERGPPLADCVLCDAVAGRLVAYFKEHHHLAQRPPCVGAVIQLLDLIRTLAPSTYLDSLQCPQVWKDVAALLELQKKPLADAVVGFVKRASDFVGKADIDGIGEKK